MTPDRILELIWPDVTEHGAAMTQERVANDGVAVNDTGPRYNAAAAAEAYSDLLAWFGKYLSA